MKRKLSKLLSIIVIVALVLSTSSVAFADVTGTATNGYLATDSIEITGGYTVGETLYVFKEADGAGSTPIKYARPTGGTYTFTGLNFGTTSGGSIYVAATTNAAIKTTVTRAAITFNKEPVTDAVSASAITINNKVRTTDTVVITGVTAGDKITAYKTETGTEYYAYATVPAGKTEVTINISAGKLASTTGGSIWIAAKNPKKHESARVEKTYSAEAVTTSPSAISEITVVNNAVIKDTVTVKNVTAGAIVKVFKESAKTTLLGSKTVATGTTSAAISLTLPALGESTTSGSIYVTVMDRDKLESEIVEKEYAAEGVTTTSSAVTVLINNNSTSGSSILVVYGLTAKDKVRVYGAFADKGTVAPKKIGTVAAKQSQVVITLPYGIVTNTGEVYVTITTVGKLESAVMTVPSSNED